MFTKYALNDGQSIKYGLWSGSLHTNSRLDFAFKEARQLSKLRHENVPVLLFFSISSGGHFVGVAKMESQTFDDMFFTRWVQFQVWKGVFKVQWLLAKDIPNKALAHIRNK